MIVPVPGRLAMQRSMLLLALLACSAVCLVHAFPYALGTEQLLDSLELEVRGDAGKAPADYTLEASHELWKATIDDHFDTSNINRPFNWSEMQYTAETENERWGPRVELGGSLVSLFRARFVSCAGSLRIHWRASSCPPSTRSVPTANLTTYSCTNAPCTHR